MKTISLEIKGISALIINRFKEQDEVPTKLSKGKKDYGSPRQQAEQTAYHDEDDKKLWIPTSWLKGSIQTVASDYKLPSTRKSAKSVSGGAIFPLEEKVYFLEEYTLSDIEVDSRPCVIQRARIMRHRARLETWSVAFNIQIEDEILNDEMVHQMLTDAGRRAGMGDYRPSKGGPFGRFLVSKWNVKSDDSFEEVTPPVRRIKKVS
jgi:hypothetical protein